MPAFGLRQPVIPKPPSRDPNLADQPAVSHDEIFRTLGIAVSTESAKTVRSSGPRAIRISCQLTRLVETVTAADCAREQTVGVFLDVE